MWLDHLKREEVHFDELRAQGYRITYTAHDEVTIEPPQDK